MTIDEKPTCDKPDSIKQCADNDIQSDYYLIWSNEHKAWWGPDHNGYTNRIERAGRYTRVDALRICNNANYYSWKQNANPDELPILEKDALELGYRPLEAVEV